MSRDNYKTISYYVQVKELINTADQHLQHASRSTPSLRCLNVETFCHHEAESFTFGILLSPNESIDLASLGT